MKVKKGALELWTSMCLAALVSAAPVSAQLALDWQQLSGEAAEHARAGDFDKAQARFEQAVAKAAESQAEDEAVRNKLYDPIWRAYKEKGVELSREGKLPQAEEAFVRAMSVARKFGKGDPRLVVSLFDLYQVRLGRGHLEDAVAAQQELHDSYNLMIPTQLLVFKKAMADLKETVDKNQGPLASDSLANLNASIKAAAAQLRLGMYAETDAMLSDRIKGLQGNGGLDPQVRDKMIVVYESLRKLTSDLESKAKMDKQLTEDDPKRIKALEHLNPNIVEGLDTYAGTPIGATP